MGSRIPAIKESVEELHQLVLSTKRERLKTRILALWMLKTGQVKSRDEAAQTLGVHRHTVSRWLQKYENGGIDELTTIRTRPNRKRVVPASVMRDLQQALSTSEHFSSYKEIQAWLHERHGLDVKYKTLYRLVRYELGFSVGDTTSSRRSIPAATTPTRSLADVSSSDQNDVVDRGVGSQTNGDGLLAASTESSLIAGIGEDSSSDLQDSGPSIPGLFRKVAAVMDARDSVSMTEVLTAIDALSALLAKAPPYGITTDDGTSTMLADGVGKRVERSRREGRSTLRQLSRNLSLGKLTETDAAAIIHGIAERLEAATGGVVTHGAASGRAAQGSQPSAPVERAPAPPSISRDGTSIHPVEIAATSEESGWSPASATPEDDRTRRILLAEEDDITATVVARRLEQAGIEVVRTCAGVETRRSIERGDAFDLFVLDSDLPDIGGLDLLRALRARPGYEMTPVIVLGWPEDEVDKKRAIELGADAFVSKPFFPREFANRVIGMISVEADPDRRKDRPASDRTGLAGRGVSSTRGTSA